jgi:hypothetical protein
MKTEINKMTSQEVTANGNPVNAFTKSSTTKRSQRNLQGFALQSTKKNMNIG